jgi:thiol-disulfide isomerase/thioredoxin
MTPIKIAILIFIMIGIPMYNSLAQSSIQPTIIAVKMDADWCGKCRVMNPKLEKIKPKFKDSTILFITFNMTDEFSTQQSELLATRLNLTDLFNMYRGRTGFIVLLDAESGEELMILQSDLSEEQLKNEIIRLL